MIWIFKKRCCKKCVWFHPRTKECTKNEGYCFGNNLSNYWCDDFVNYFKILFKKGEK